MNQDLAFRLGATVRGGSEVDKFNKSLRDTRKSADSAESGLARLGRGLRLLAGAYAIKQGVDFAKGIISTAANLDDLSQKTGIAVNALSGYEEAAKQAGTSIEALTGVFRKFSVNIVDAKNGNDQLVAAFKNLGVSTDDLKSKSPDQLIAQLADRFAQLQDGPEKAALAVRLFGKSGADIIPFLNKGSEALSKFSLGISDDFANRAAEFEDALAEMGTSAKRFAAQGIEAALPAFRDILNAFKQAPGEGVGVKQIFQVIGDAARILAVILNGVGTAFIDLFDGAINLSTRATARIALAFENITDRLRTFVDQAKALRNLDFDQASRLGNDFQARLTERNRLINESNKRLEDEFDARQKARDQGLLQRQSALLKNFGNPEGAAADTVPDIRNNASLPRASTEGIGTAQERDRVEEFLALQRRENEQRRAALGDLNLTAIELEKVKAARELENEALRASKGLNNEQKEALAQGTEEIKKQREALIDLENQQKRSFSGGLRKGLRDIADEASNLGKQIEDVAKNSFKSLEDAVVSFVTTGKFNFADFAKSVIEDLTRIAVRQAIIAPIAGAFGGLFTPTPAPAAFANGGIMTARGEVPLKKYARGGVANSPQLALFGEGSRPEAFVPLPDGRRIPVAMQGAPSGGDVNVMVTVNLDGGTTDTQSNEESGKQLGTLIANAVKSELINQRRPGGLLAG